MQRNLINSEYSKAIIILKHYTRYYQERTSEQIYSSNNDHLK